MPDAGDLARDLERMQTETGEAAATEADAPAPRDAAEALQAMGGAAPAGGVAAKAREFASRNEEADGPSDELRPQDLNPEALRRKAAGAVGRMVAGAAMTAIGIGLSVFTFLQPVEGRFYIFYGLPFAGLGILGNAFVMRRHCLALIERLERLNRLRKP